MKRLIATAMVMAMLLGSAPFLAAEESTPPPQPKAVPAPGQRSGSSMSSAALMGLLGAAPKPAGSSQEQPLYPMFQMLGPNMSGNTSLTPEAMGTLLTMQGEMMMKMGEVLMKYGQMMSGKTN